MTRFGIVQIAQLRCFLFVQFVLTFAVCGVTMRSKRKGVKKMLSDILYQQEHELLHKIVREKNLFRKFFLAMKIEAITEAFADSIDHAA